MRLQFRRGEITLYEWIPVKLRLHGLLEKGELERLRELMRSPSVVCHNERQLTKQKVRGRFSEIVFDDHLTLEYGNVSEKQSRYEEMLAAMIVDQWNWIRDHKHVRVIDSSNAVRSLQMAEQATKMAQTF